MAVTIHDVAKLAGVGIGTVSSVLNDSRPVNENTRRRVLAAIAELDFVPNPSGRRLSMGKTQIIAVIVPYFTRASQFERLRGVMSMISQSDYSINFFAIETPGQRDKILQTVPRQGRVDGLLIFSLTLTDADVERIHREEISAVLIESYHPDLNSIVLDDTTAVEEAVRYIIQLGHRRIGFVNEIVDTIFEFPFSRNRYQGYCNALDEAGIPILPKYHRRGEHCREDGKKLALDLLKLPDPPTAIFAYSDEMALGVLEAARELNLEVPHDLSIIGYDDIELAHFVRLSTVRQNLFLSGARGVEMLLNTIEAPEENTPDRIQLPTEFILRDTTSPPLNC